MAVRDGNNSDTKTMGGKDSNLNLELVIYKDQESIRKKKEADLQFVTVEAMDQKGFKDSKLLDARLKRFTKIETVYSLAYDPLFPSFISSQKSSLSDKKEKEPIVLDKERVCEILGVQPRDFYLEHLGPYRFGQVKFKASLKPDTYEEDMSIEELKEHGRYYRYEPTEAYMEWQKMKKLETERAKAGGGSGSKVTNAVGEEGNNEKIEGLQTPPTTAK